MRNGTTRRRQLLVLIAAFAFAGAPACGGPEDPRPQDRDGDGHDASEDCNDEDPTIHPGATEVCDGVDNDCDGNIDDGPGSTTWYRDADGDGYGRADETQVACTRPAGYVAASGDCDDGDGDIHPGALEVCDGADNDCDGYTDGPDATGAATWYWDDDGDGFGLSDATQIACAQPAGYVAASGDCDDSNEHIHPDATEVCDGADNDCDGQTDEPDADGAVTWYRDDDGDRYGRDDDTQVACVQPAGYAEVAGDCDDTDGDVHPGAVEVCDGADNDCDGQTDGPDAEDAGTWYLDADGDGFGRADATALACLAPAGHAAGAGDCSDDASAIHPGAVEVCDGTDNDCDGQVDEPDALGAATWYQDGDGDGYGLTAVTQVACTRPAGHAAVGGDCDDGSDAAHPGAAEICVNGQDENCDGVADGGCVVTHCGDVTADATWEAHLVHRVTCNVFVQGAARPTLTIEDGAVVTFATSTHLAVGYASYGRLVVDGAVQGVTFGATVATPTPGIWSGLYLGPYDEGSELTGLTVEHGGGNGYGGIRLEGADPVLTGCTVRYSSQHGLHGGGAAFPRIVDSVFEDNGQDGVYLDGGSGLDRTGSPSFTGNVLTGNSGAALTLPANCAGEVDASSSFSGNTIDAVRLTADDVDTTATWQALDVPFRVVGNVNVQHQSHPVLTLADGARVTFATSTHLAVGYASYGKLVVAGASTGVTFRSAAATPAPGDWSGLYLGPYDQGSALTGLTVEHGGSNGYGGIRLEGADPVLVGCAVRQSSQHGLHGGGGAFPRISGSTFALNALDGIFLDGGSGLDRTGSPSFTGNTLIGNAGAALTLPANYAGELDASSTFTGNAIDAVRLTADDVDTTATWQALDVPFRVSGNVSLQGSAHPVLTVLDGARVTFSTNTQLAVGYASYGRLVVTGMPTGVTFRSAATVPARGDWYGLYLGPYDEGSQLTGLTVEHGGANGYGGIRLEGADPVLVGCAVRHSSQHGLHGGGAAFPRISGSTFALNALDGIFLEGGAGLDRTGSPSFTGNTLTGNSGAAITLPANYAGELDASSSFLGNTIPAVRLTADDVDTTATWQDLDAPYRIVGNVYVQHSSHPVLTLSAGTLVTFATNTQLAVGYASYGSLTVAGTVAAPVYFTSVSDTPTSGSWYGLYYGPYCDVATTVMSHAVVEWGGANGYGNIHIQGCDGTFADSLIQHSSTWGIYRGSGIPTLTNLTYSDNASGSLF